MICMRLQRIANIAALVMLAAGLVRLCTSASSPVDSACEVASLSPAASNAVSLRIYDVSDILAAMVEQLPPDYDPAVPVRRHLTPTFIDDGPPPKPRTPMERNRLILKLQQERLERIFESEEGQPRCVDGRLILLRTTEGHRDVERFLRVLRELKQQ